MAADSRFELVRRGYDPLPVDREIRALNLEVNRLREQNLELSEQLKVINHKLAQAEQEISLRSQPNYSALGTKAATILSTAEELAMELSQQAQQQADELIRSVEADLQARTQEIEQRYQEQLATSERRSERRLSEAEIDAKQITQQAESKARQLILEAEAEAGRIRGQVATEIAAMRVSATRELEARRAQLEAEFANRNLNATSDAEESVKERVRQELEAQLAQRRKAAEQEYEAKHQEAVRQTQQYLEAAQKDITDLKLAARTLRLEVETLELEATKTQTRMLQEARDRAEALVHVAELEAVALSDQAQREAFDLVRNARAELENLQNAVLSSKTYLNNLRSVVAEVEKLEVADGPSSDQ